MRPSIEFAGRRLIAVGAPRLAAAVTWAMLAATVWPVGTDAPAITTGLLGISAFFVVDGLRNRATGELALACALVMAAYARGLVFTDGVDGAAPIVAVALTAYLLAATVAAEPPVDQDAGRRAARRRIGALWLSFSAVSALLTAALTDIPTRPHRLVWILGFAASVATAAIAVRLARDRLPHPQP